MRRKKWEEICDSEQEPLQELEKTPLRMGVSGAPACCHKHPWAVGEVVTQNPACTITLQSWDSISHTGSTIRSDFNPVQTFRAACLTTRRCPLAMAQISVSTYIFLKEYIDNETKLQQIPTIFYYKTDGRTPSQNEGDSRVT